MKQAALRIAALASALAALCAPTAGPAETPAPAPEVIYEDADIHGRAIHTFRDDGKPVTVVLGDFELAAGRYRVAGRDAVIWIRSETVRGARRHRITVYVEGEASVVRADGERSADESMVVTMVQEGELTARGPVRRRPLTDLPLYRRAREATRGEAEPPEPADPPAEADSGTDAEPDGSPAEVEPGPDARPGPPAEAPPTLPVEYRADETTSRMMGAERVTIARGNVYISRGHPESNQYAEMQAQSAVIFSAETERRDHTAGPDPFDLGSLDGETITGVYLEGDVVMSRGERYVRGPRAYYDFLTNRAYVPDAVFRTVQEQRDFPVYIRAAEMRQLSSREVYFRDAMVTTSDFASPTHHVHASSTYLMDQTPYDEEGEPLGRQSWRARMKNLTYNLRGLPVFWSPWWQGEFTRDQTSLHNLQVGFHGKFGFGVESEWNLFRLIGLVRPGGVRAYLDLDWYESGLIGGTRWKYDRQDGPRRYSGYARFFGLVDGRGDDDFGDRRKNISAPKERGRLLWRHKEYLPRSWEAQAEVSYLCDKNFLEQYWRSEFYAGKDQETLIYAKKQQDNWAFTALAKYKLNRFDTQKEAAPELGLHLIGQPLADVLTYFGESRAGYVRYDTANDSTMAPSDLLFRADTRHELNVPIRLGPAKLVPYAVGRATYWGDQPRVAEGYPAAGEHCRLYGQVGARAAMTFWRLWPDVESRLWDLHGLRHVVTPELGVMFSDTGGVSPNELYPIDPDVEEHLRRQNGFSAGVHTRLQTKRGPAGNRHIADWMRFSAVLGVYDNGPDLAPADGRFFMYRPEYSQGNNHLNLDYTWHISDSTTFLTDMNVDTDHCSIGWWNAGLSVVRSPRMAYFAGMRLLPDMDSGVGTFGVRYKVNERYSITALEQYDFDFDSGKNLATRLTIVRRFPRWNVGFTFMFDRTAGDDDVGFMVTVWPEGIPEVRIGGFRMSLLGKSDEN